MLSCNSVLKLEVLTNQAAEKPTPIGLVFLSP